MSNVFVAIGYDRHVDDTVTVHKTLEGAIAQCIKFMSFEPYPVRYPEGWKRQEDLEDASWVYAIAYTQVDDGPRARVEITPLKE